MNASTRRIEYLARTIVNRLEDRGLVEFSDAERGIEIMIRTLEEHFRAVEALEAEARSRLGTQPGGRAPSEREIEDEMRRLALERGVTV
ncbi:MAG TPA: hypothetical protein VMS56_04780 [Thermoanaerobaculia bacterium]|nr:hypothetical protein [Thermoanaerobaculia bacterium]